MKPFDHLASSSIPITHSTQIEGFEGAGIGKIVQLKEGMKTSKIVEMVKEHLVLEHGTSAGYTL